MDETPTGDPPVTLKQVIATERVAIDTRRTRSQTGDGAARPAGVALSGGGIRSATFCLGVLQRFHAHGLLTAFDYLSTVSGGGYLGGWWSALLSRTQDGKEAWPLFPSPRERDPDREHHLLSHLRLHSNYLIPELGAMSWDTWRAATVIGRNLVLTWLVLVPFVFAAVVVSQMYFLLVAPDLIVGTDWNNLRDGVWRWWAAAAPPLLGLLVAVGALTFLWMRYQGIKPWAPFVGWWASLLMMVTLLTVFARKDDGGAISQSVTQMAADEPERTILVCLAGAGLLLAYRVALDWKRRAGIRDRSVRRNQIAYVQQLYVMLLAAAAALLAAGGLGHLLVGTLDLAIEGAGGLASAALTLAGAGFTAFRSAGVSQGGSSIVSRLLMRIAPTALVLVILAAMAALSRMLLSAAVRSEALFAALLLASLGGILLAWAYAACETNWVRLHGSPKWCHVGTVVVGLTAGLVVFVAGPRELGADAPRWGLMALTVGSFFIVARRLAGTLRSDEERAGHLAPPSQTLVLALFAAGATAGFVVGRFVDPFLLPPALLVGRLSQIATVVSLALLALTISAGEEGRSKSIHLLLYALAVGAVWVILALAGWPDRVAPLIAACAVLAATGTWILAFGWATDPNSLALHAFYKSRLVRAYLGASNPRRHAEANLIDDAVSGDDLPLTALRNTERGAPYHLINVTLNLAGDHTLGSIQRRAAPFVLTRDYCGSRHSAASFRPTAEYMGGQLSLGTAVAVSGAAASPEMGSQTPSTAVSMLLTMFNVRLGYWAPRPAGESWRARQARFWAFHTLREFMSRTSSRSSYAFLSDGGHFENTAVYPLVERGCRLVVAIDCGADPQRIFEDYGTLIRRCRIDFGAEIDIDIEALRAAAANSLSKAAFVVGTITYGDEHLRDIDDPTPQDLTGHILVIKPSLVGTEPLDVRQYSSSNPAFPQQPTSDQFYDEAQFESYRRLGVHCADAALHAMFPNGAVDAATFSGAVAALAGHGSGETQILAAQ